MKYFIISIILFMGCATNAYNTPFINADETVKLDFGMNRDEVLSILNEPLFVAYGDNDEIIWVYEVRTIQVNSQAQPNGTTQPNKTSTKIKHDSPLHRLSLTFENGKLVKWGPYNGQ
tara:strand:+ start:124 stop:474 length:351 start_codon:yes stop_codon:yes gene_type:complete